MPREELELKGLFNSLDESRTPRGRAFSSMNVSTDEGILQVGRRYRLVGARAGTAAGDVGWGLGYGKFGCNETQRLTASGNPTGGTVTLVWSGQTTATIPFNATAEQVLTALQGLTAIEPGDVSCSGGPWPVFPIDVHFRGRYARLDVAAITRGTNSLTGGTSPDVTVSERVKGGDAEEYLAVVQHDGEATARLYSVHPSTGAYTQLATGLTASDWHFLQYGDRIYAANQTDGLLYKQLGGAWSGQLSLPSFGNPASAPTIGGTAFSFLGFDWGVTPTFGSFTGWGSNPTISVVGTPGSYQLTILLNAALTNDTVSFTATFPVGVTRFFDYHDYIVTQFSGEAATDAIEPGSVEIVLINGDTPAAEITPQYASDGSETESSLGFSGRRDFQFADVSRELRDNIRGIRVTFTVRRGTSTKKLWFNLIQRGVWPNDLRSGISMERGATRRSIEYAYTWYQTSTGVESRLSPSTLSPALPQTVRTGCWIPVIAAGCPGLTTSDRIRFYRKDRFGIWRRIGDVANVTSGTATFTDTRTLNELDALDAYGSIQLPGGYNPESLSAFKQTLAVAADRKIWLSGVGKPLVFAPDPDDASAPPLDPADVDRPRTAFASDTRTEELQAVVGQDSAYLVGTLTSYAMVGDRPSDLTPPRRVPGSRGTPSRRGACALGGGVLVGALDGLWYFSVGRGFSGEDNGAMVRREETLEVRKSWAHLVAGGASSLVVVEHEEDVWAFNGTKYFKISRNQQFEQGVFPDAVKAALPNRERGLRWLDSRGRLMEFAAVQTDAGASVTWTYSTGILDGPRLKITDIEIQCAGRPGVAIDVLQGDKKLETRLIDVDQDGKLHRLPCVVQPGNRFRLRFSGNQNDRIFSVAVVTEGASGGKAN